MKIYFKIVLILLLITSINLSCNTAPKSNEVNGNASTEFNTDSDSQIGQGKVAVIKPSDFKEKSENQIIVDIRTPGEYNEGHLKGALNINFTSRNFSEQISKLDKSKPVFIYCKTGRRSSSASVEMLKLGFEQVYDLEGGVLNWTRNKNEIIRD